MFQSRRVGLEVQECTNCFGQIESMDKPMNYSDHNGVCATFLMRADPPTESLSDRARHIATERLFLEKSLRILEEGEVRVLWDRRLCEFLDKVLI